MHSVKLYSLGLLLLLGACEKVKTETPFVWPARDLEIAVDTSPMSLETQGQKISYLVGMDNARNIKAMEIDFDNNAFNRGFADGLSAAEPQLSEEQIATVVKAFETEMMAKRETQQKVQEEATALQADSNSSEGVEFLTANGVKEGVSTTVSGLQYKVITAGDGAKPTVESTVEVHYAGRLLDGTEFDSSIKRGVPAQFGVTQVIPGWTEALQLMSEGATWELYIPADLAYGPGGQGPIGPNQMLIFEVQLLQANVADES